MVMSLKIIIFKNISIKIFSIREWGWWCSPCRHAGRGAPQGYQFSSTLFLDFFFFNHLFCLEVCGWNWCIITLLELLLVSSPGLENFLGHCWCLLSDSPQ